MFPKLSKYIGDGIFSVHFIFNIQSVFWRKPTAISLWRHTMAKCLKNSWSGRVQWCKVNVSVRYQLILLHLLSIYNPLPFYPTRPPFYFKVWVEWQRGLLKISLSTHPNAALALKAKIRDINKFTDNFPSIKYKGRKVKINPFWPTRGKTKLLLFWYIKRGIYMWFISSNKPHTTRN